MRASRNHTDVAFEDLDGLDWQHDPAYQQMATKREATQQRLRELPTEIAAATDALASAQAELDRQEMFWLVQRTDAKTLEQARKAHTQAQEGLRRLQAEQLLATEELPRLQAAVRLIATEARERTAAQLRRLYAEAARELAELLPEFERLHERLRAIHHRATQNFPMRLQGPFPRPNPRPELDDNGVPMTAGLPWLMIRELFEYPQGSRLQRLEDDIARYLEEQP